MNTAVHHYRRGMGDPCGQGAAIAHTVAGGVLTTAAAVDPEPISKAVLGVAALIQNFFGHPDCSKIAATHIVDQAEQLLKQNLQAWQSLPANQKNVATQQTALQNFDNVWAQVVQACQQIPGTAGQNCIGDRQQGACHYNVSGNCWNWFVGYRDPIANDPAVLTVSAAATNLFSSLTGGINANLVIGIALIGGALIVGEIS